MKEGTFLWESQLGSFMGLDFDDYKAFLGIPYAKADRFCYAMAVESFEGTFDATKHGNVCPQNRTHYEHLEIPERAFYHKEFREGQEFIYDEDCLNLNIFMPNDDGPHPVLVFIHGGGFDSGANYDSAITGAAYAKRGIVFVSIHYRVSIFGYLTHEDIKTEFGHEGNFGLDDQYQAICWVKKHIADFKGDPDNITLMGQSAGAISIQYLCLSKKCQGLFNRAIMLSGGGMFPKFALPRPAENTREYWKDFMSCAKVESLDELKTLDTYSIFTAIEELKSRRKDNTYNTMPVIDGYLIEDAVDKLIAHPLPIDYMIGYTNNDMYAPIMGYISHKYAKENQAYLYYFDIDAPGNDKNGAFHSSDLRYVFGSLKDSHRPYDAEDYKASDLLIAYIINFAKNGNPNGENLPNWQTAAKANKALRIRKPVSKIKMSKAHWIKLAANLLSKGDPT